MGSGQRFVGGIELLGAVAISSPCTFAVVARDSEAILSDPGLLDTNSGGVRTSLASLSYPPSLAVRDTNRSVMPVELGLLSSTPLGSL